jgi:hypothetical protein
MSPFPCVVSSLGRLDVADDGPVAQNDVVHHGLGHLKEAGETPERCVTVSAWGAGW